MAKKGMRSLLFRGSSSSSSSSSSSLPASSKETHGSPMMFERLSKLEAIVAKWDPEGSDFAKITSLFHESREEARRFLLAVSDINHVMHYFMIATVAASSPASTARHDLVRAHRLMATAVKRLQKEFFQILSANRDRLDTDSLTSTPATFSDAGVANADGSSEDNELKHDGESVREVECLPSAAMVHLRSIANCMVSVGYAKECVEIYRDVRKSIVDEGIYRLGFQRLSRSQIKRLDPESVEHRIKNWFAAARVVIETLFSGERALCDYVFSSSAHINESCFAEITRDAAIQFLEFPELIATNASKTTMKNKSTRSHSRSAERAMYYLLDLRNCVTDLWPEIETVFSYNATSTVRSQALSSLQKLGDSVQTTIADYEVAIQKDAVKGPAIPGVGLHPLTHRVMNDLALLADYIPALTDIFVDQSLPNNDPPSSSVSARFAWLVLVLLCKLDSKAELHKDKALSYLFLANNVHYIVKKVATTRNLRELLGKEWLRKHEEKARSFGTSYERLRWAKVAAALEEEKIGVFDKDFQVDVHRAAGA